MDDPSKTHDTAEGFRNDYPTGPRGVMKRGETRKLEGSLSDPRQARTVSEQAAVE